MHIHRGERTGFALAVAIATLVVIGAMIGGVFFASAQEHRIGRNMLLQTRALTAAEYGLNAAVTQSNWSPGWNTLGTGSVVVVPMNPGGGAIDTVRLTKLNDHTFFVLSEAISRAGTAVWARRRVGGLAVLNPPILTMPAALTLRDSAELTATSFIDGSDRTYGGWNCPPPGAPIGGLALADTSRIATSGCSGFSCISGSPSVLETPAASDTGTYFTYGHVGWSDITAMSSAPVSAGAFLSGIRESYTATGACNTSDPRNWGDPYKGASQPARACESYFPVIHAQGDLSLAGGYGQGILLVAGNLKVSGGFEFFGPVIVRGALIGSGQGGRFHGGVLAARANLAASMIEYSSCVMGKSLMAAATPAMAAARSWVEVY